MAESMTFQRQVLGEVLNHWLRERSATAYGLERLQACRSSGGHGLIGAIARTTSVRLFHGRMDSSCVRHLRYAFLA